MAVVEHTCTGCVPIDTSIIEAYLMLIATNSRVDSQEGARVIAEQEREAAEAIRQTTFEENEAEREATFSAAEQERASAETARVAAEATRAASESTRIGAETSRVSAEASRVSAEQSRSTAEGDRVLAENARKDAEDTRASAESVREDNENSRIYNEQSREDTFQLQMREIDSAIETAESDHNTATADHTTAAADHTASTAATAAATSAAAAADAAREAIQSDLALKANVADVYDKTTADDRFAKKAGDPQQDFRAKKITSASVDTEALSITDYSTDAQILQNLAQQEQSARYTLPAADGTLARQEDVDEAVSQLGQKLNELETEINEKPGAANVGLVDFAISDNAGSQIVAFGDGHIKTKNFDSKSAVSFINKASAILGNVKTINKTSIPSCLSKLAKIKNGDNAVLNLGMVGDSWTQGVGTDEMDRITYVKYLTRLLWEKYGYAGLGWFDFGYSNSDMKCADDTCISLVKSGTINYVTRVAASLGIARSHAVFSSGASYTLTLVDANRPIDKAVIWFYNGAAFTYQINDGEAVQVTAASSGGWQSVTINADITKIKITATADSTIIFGIDFSYGNRGVKVHKLGNRAATSTDFVEGTAASWEEGVSKLNLDILTEALYTNDRWIDNVAPSVVVANIQELFGRFKAVAPYADVVCIAPSDNYESGTHPYTTEQYAFAVFDYCRENGYPFIDLIPLFGTKEQVQNLGLFYDNLHPNFAGANLIGNYIFDELFKLF